MTCIDSDFIFCLLSKCDIPTSKATKCEELLSHQMLNIVSSSYTVATGGTCLSRLMISSAECKNSDRPSAYICPVMMCRHLTDDATPSERIHQHFLLSLFWILPLKQQPRRCCDCAVEFTWYTHALFCV